MPMLTKRDMVNTITMAIAEHLTDEDIKLLIEQGGILVEVMGGLMQIYKAWGQTTFYPGAYAGESCRSSDRLRLHIALAPEGVSASDARRCILHELAHVVVYARYLRKMANALGVPVPIRMRRSDHERMRQRLSNTQFAECDPMRDGWHSMEWRLLYGQLLGRGAFSPVGLDEIAGPYPKDLGMALPPHVGFWIDPNALRRILLNRERYGAKWRLRDWLSRDLRASLGIADIGVARLGAAYSY